MALSYLVKFLGLLDNLSPGQLNNTSPHTKTLQQFWEQHDYTEICTANKSPRLAFFPVANNKKQEKWKAKSKPFFFIVLEILQSKVLQDIYQEYREDIHKT